jgi:GT2 family glycosyltransferase
VKISVIIPSYNQGRFIRRTIESILRQSGPPAQILVSDGGSTDETVSVLREYGGRIEWWSEKDGGFADAVNKALPRVTGDVVAIQSSDDYYLPDAFTAAARAFACSDAAVVSGGAVSIDLEHRIKNVFRHHGRLDPRRFLREGVGIPQHATFIRAPVLRELGGVRPEVDMCADYDLWCRAILLHPCFAFRKVIAVYQHHPTQRTATSRAWLRSLVTTHHHLANTPPYRERFPLGAAEQARLNDYWEVVWASNTRDPRASDIARAKLSRLRGHACATRAAIAFVAFRNEPDRKRRLLLHLRSGQFLPFLWRRGLVLREHLERRLARARIDTRWTERSRGSREFPRPGKVGF